MIKTAGIIFKTIPYGESSQILEVYTEVQGMASFIVSGVRNKKTNLQYLYQVLQPINIVFYPSKGNALKRIKEASLIYRYQKIFADIPTNAIAACIIDFSRQCIKESESNPELFHFIQSELLTLDQAENIDPNFHLKFLFSLSQKIGIFPNNANAENALFDLREGAFIESDQADPMYCLSKDLSQIFSLFTRNTTETIKLNRTQRNATLDALCSYFTYHLQNFKKPKSIDIIKVIFAT